MTRSTASVTVILDVFDAVDESPLANLPNTPPFENGTYLCTYNKQTIRLFSQHKSSNGRLWNLSVTAFNTLRNDDNNGNWIDVITVPPGIVLFEGIVTTDIGPLWQVFIPDPVLQKIIDWNPKPRSGLTQIFKAQKYFLTEWEMGHRRLTDVNGHASELQSLLHEIMKTKKVTAISEDDLGIKWSLVPSINIVQQLSQINISPPSDATRIEYDHYGRHLQKAFCQRHSISERMHISSQPVIHGIQFSSPVPVFENGQNNSNDFKDIFIHKQQIKVKTHLIARAYDLQLPVKLSDEEFSCLQAACNSTTACGLILSLQLLNDTIRIITDGLDDTMPGAGVIKRTMVDAYCLLASLASGFDVLTNTVTTSTVKTYANPFDVQFRMLRTRNTVEDGQASKAQRDTRTFSNIMHHLKIVIHPKCQLHLQNGVFIPYGTGSAIQLQLTGQYVDPYGYNYFDVHGSRCYSASEIVDDIQHRFPSYCQRYRILRRLEAYAIVIGLLLNKPRQNIPIAKETYQITTARRQFPNESKELKAIKREVLRVRESAILEEKSDSARAIMLLNLANLWINYDPQHARDLARVVLLEFGAGTLTDQQEYVRAKILRDACVLLICSMSTMDANINYLTFEEVNSFIKTLGLESRRLQLEFCGYEEAIYLRAIEVGMAQSLKLESWDTIMLLLRRLKNLMIDMDRALEGVEEDGGEICAWLILRNHMIQYLSEHLVNEFTILSDKYAIAGGERQSTSDDMRRTLFLLNFVESDTSQQQKPGVRIENATAAIGFTALIYLLVHKKWLSDGGGTMEHRARLSNDDDEGATEFCEQITYLIRSLCASLHVASTTTDAHILRHWMQIARCTVNHLNHTVILLQRSQRELELNRAYEKMMKETELLEGAPPRSKEQHDKAQLLLKVAHIARHLAEEMQAIEIVQESAVAIAFAYRKLDEEALMRVWQRTSVTDGVRLKFYVEGSG